MAHTSASSTGGKPPTGKVTPQMATPGAAMPGTMGGSSSDPVLSHGGQYSAPYTNVAAPPKAEAAPVPPPPPQQQPSPQQQHVPPKGTPPHAQAPPQKAGSTGGGPAEAKGKSAGGAVIARNDSAADPRALYPKPPYDERTQHAPGIEAEMHTRPDFGESSYRGSGKLKDKVCLVTGGDSGIGRAVALAFAREGARAVVIQCLKEEEVDARETQRVVEAEKCQFAAIPTDLDSDESCKALIASVVQKFGAPDVVVLNAAVQSKSVGGVEHMEPERVRKTFAVNIQSMIFTVAQLKQHLKPGSAIITTASIQSYDPKPAILDYATTKAAIVAFTKGMSRELIAKGVRINCVAPGPVWTPLIAQSFDAEAVKHFGGDSEANPYGRPAQPAELAPAYVFLAAGATASYITGEVVGVTGGRLLS